MSSPFSFADARRIVRDHLLDHWTSAHGRLHIAAQGYESPTHWRVLAESQPLPPEDEAETDSAEPLPQQAYLVSKETGALETVAVDDQRLGAMTPYGASA